MGAGVPVAGAHEPARDARVAGRGPALGRAPCGVRCRTWRRGVRVPRVGRHGRQGHRSRDRAFARDGALRRPGPSVTRGGAGRVPGGRPRQRPCRTGCRRADRPGRSAGARDDRILARPRLRCRPRIDAMRERDAPGGQQVESREHERGEPEGERNRYQAAREPHAARPPAGGIGEHGRAARSARRASAGEIDGLPGEPPCSRCRSSHPALRFRPRQEHGANVRGLSETRMRRPRHETRRRGRIAQEDGSNGCVESRATERCFHPRPRRDDAARMTSVFEASVAEAPARELERRAASSTSRSTGAARPACTCVGGPGVARSWTMR